MNKPKWNNIVLMDFSGIYKTEEFYKKWENTAATWMDCTGISGTNCYCDETAERELSKRMDGLGPEGIHFLDSGNYHYVTKLWLEQVREPFDLLVFDHHTDMQPPVFGDILSCGGWIKKALETNPLLNRVFLVGPPKEALEKARGVLTPEQCGRVFRVGGDESVLPRVALWLEEAAERPLYISVDKDILSPAYARTNWDQGNAGLQTVLEVIRQAASKRRVLGMDVCGENPEGLEQADADEECRINDRTNQQLCQIYFAIYNSDARKEWTVPVTIQ